VLVVDADPATRPTLAAAVAGAGYRVRLEASAGAGQARLETARPDALVLGLTAPALDALALGAAAVRAGVPLLLCTAPGQTALWRLGLEIGAADFLCAPVDHDELAARVAAALWRATAAAAAAPPADQLPRRGPAGALRVGDLAVWPAAHAVTLAGQEVRLTRTEFRLLQALAERPDETHPRDELAAALWPVPDAGLRRSLDLHVHRLRAKLRSPAGAGRTPRILAVRGVGYKLARTVGPQRESGETTDHGAAARP
jgi:DNA-binding response OmpR family regulator